MPTSNFDRRIRVMAELKRAQKSGAMERARKLQLKAKPRSAKGRARVKYGPAP